MNVPRMPVVFIGHGSPMNAIEDNKFTKAWQKLAEDLPRPKAILCISAHYMTKGLHAVSLPNPQTIHDFYGFPQALFDVQYKAPGSPELAERVVGLLGEKARLSEDWGLDHGAWSVLKVMYPKADIPIVQLSLDLSKSALEQWEIGSLLKPLRDEGILILGSGNVVHNLREIRMHAQEPLPWAKSFGEAVHALVLEGRYEDIRDYKTFEGSLLSVNSSEHFVPLINTLGATDKNDRVEAINHDYVWGSLSMTSYALYSNNKENT